MKDIISKDQSSDEKIEKIKKLIEVTKDLKKNEKDKMLLAAYDKRIEKQYEKLAKIYIFKKAIEVGAE